MEETDGQTNWDSARRTKKYTTHKRAKLKGSNFLSEADTQM